MAKIKQSVGLQLRDVRLHSAAQPFEHTFAPGLNVVLGANRSGKTDLCRLVAGLPTVASGEVWLHGQAIAAQPTRQRSVAYVYQAFVNYPNLTVADNIMSPLVAQGQLQRAQMRELAEDLARRLGIAELMQRYPAELSGGQQQRVAIARALAKQADVLLLDEPLVNLDFKLRESLTRELREILKALGTIVIYTSSDRRDAMGMADELLVLDGGEYVQAGVPMQVYTQPRNMAAMSIMSDPQVNPWQQGALRPEHVLLQRTAEVGTDYVQTRMDVQGVETNGSETLIFGQVEGHLWVIHQPGMVQVDVDAALPICFRADDVVSFSVPG